MGWFSLGSPKGWPDGWSAPAPYRGKTFPIQWIKRRPAMKKDIQAIVDHLRDRGVANPNYDELTLVGKGDPSYTTARIEYIKAIPRRWWEVFRF